LRLDALCPQLLDFLCEDSLSRSCAVDTVGLDGDDDTATNLQEHVGVESNDTGLVGLGNVGKDTVDHGDEHSVSERVTGILNNGDDVGAVLGHVDKITARSVGEFDGVDVSGRANEIGDVTDGGTRGSTKVEDLGTGVHVDLLNTTFFLC
jgi:hypothetical protein